jgi:hypothetical protein
MNSCTVCRLPVLELDGQFENLDSYYIESEDPAADLAGECHSCCIASSAYGHVWHAWRVHNYTSVRSYRIAAEQDGWTVLLHKRHPEVLAFHVAGFSVGAERSPQRGREQVVDGGVLVAVDQEFNLVLNDRQIVAEVKSCLKKDRRYSIVAMLNALGIADRIQWPQALDKAFFVFDAKLQQEWTETALSMRAQYQKFLPTLVAQFWKKL